MDRLHVKVLVIGGGVVGCSILYHLTKLGWSDVALVERKELTAGSSWHAAGGFHAINSDPGIAALQSYTIRLYDEIEKVSGQNIGMHLTGGLNIAATPERWEFLRADHARHCVMGLDTQPLGPAEIKAMCPLIDITGVEGALYDRNEGHVDPSGVTHAYAKAARLGGATIHRHTRVMDLTPTGRGTWRVVTDQGEIEAEHVVNAAGLWAREMGRMVGVDLPLIPMEHHYLLTDDIPEVMALGRDELPLILDLDAEIYLRQERGGMLVGVYEKEATPWAVAGTPWDYGETELLEPRLDRIGDALMKGYQRFPAVAAAGIRRIVNGPFTFTPDGNPLIGPVRGVPNYWSACGVMAGFAQGGGVGLSIAEWMVHGEPGTDIFAMDVARFGGHASETWVIDKAREFYSNRFLLAYPNEHWPAGRPAKVSPLYDLQRARGGVFGASYGAEIPLYFATDDEPTVEAPTLRRSNAFGPVARVVAAVRDGVGVLDASSFGKYEVTGRGAAAALDRLLANRLPGVGRVRLAPMLAESGRLMGDLTVMQPEPGRFLLFGSGYLQEWHGRWFDENLAGEGVGVRNLSDAWAGIHLIGPKARDVLAALTPANVSVAAFKPFTARWIDVGLARMLAARLSLTGELSFELYAPAGQMRGVYAAVLAAGSPYGIVDIGFHALNAMRLEKGIGIWSREFSRDYTAVQSGLDRFVAADKGDFIGRDAFLREREESGGRVLATFAVESADADPVGFEPVWQGTARVGFVTSGGYGHRVGHGIAMAYVDRTALDGGGFEVSILGTRRPARLLASPAYDSGGGRARA